MQSAVTSLFPIIGLTLLFILGLPIFAVQHNRRGKPKTDITLTIARKGEPKPIVLKITREVIKVQSVKSKVVEPGYGYLRVAQFQENMQSQARNMFTGMNFPGFSPKSDPEKK